MSSGMLEQATKMRQLQESLQTLRVRDINLMHEVIMACKLNLALITRTTKEEYEGKRRMLKLADWREN